METTKEKFEGLIKKASQPINQEKENKETKKEKPEPKKKKTKVKKENDTNK